MSLIGSCVALVETYFFLSLSVVLPFRRIPFRQMGVPVSLNPVSPNPVSSPLSGYLGGRRTFRTFRSHNPNNHDNDLPFIYTL